MNGSREFPGHPEVRKVKIEEGNKIMGELN